MPKTLTHQIIALKAVQMYQSKCEGKLKVLSLFLAQKGLKIGKKYP